MLVESVLVEEGARGRGLGRQLMAGVEQRAREMGMARVVLSTSDKQVVTETALHTTTPSHHPTRHPPPRRPTRTHPPIRAHSSVNLLCVVFWMLVVYSEICRVTDGACWWSSVRV